VFALVLTGAPGAGKTSVAEALSDLLVGGDVRHALIETEALTSAHPALSDEEWLMPVQAVCDLYRHFGYPLLLVVATMESDADLRGLLAASGADEHAVVTLAAEPATLRRRILAREPEGWSGRDELAAASTRLASAIAALEDVALALSTEDQAPETVARRIHAALALDAVRG
jgi:broad-specificity NMP kinase